MSKCYIMLTIKVFLKKLNIITIKVTISTQKCVGTVGFTSK